MVMEWVRLTLGHLTTSRKILCNKIHCKIPPDPQLSRVHPSYIVIGSQRPKAYLRIEILEFQKNRAIHLLAHLLILS